MTWYGFLNLSFWGYVTFLLILTHITIISVTVYLHRAQAHRALEVSSGLAHFFRFWLWLTTGMSTRAWVSIHRKHHAKCETAEDPHSPQIYGLRKVLLEGAELYRMEAKNAETLQRYGQGTPEDWLERRVYAKHSVAGVLCLLGIDLVLLGIPGLTIWAIQMAWIPFFAAGVVNGIGHYWGYRNFECPDAARNVIPWGILIGGEELHNNHHTFPTSAKLSVKKWEFDLGWLYIRLFQALGLVKVKRLPPKIFYASDKLQIDLETLKAVISNRFYIMTRYSQEVLLPLLREEKKRACRASQSLLKRAHVLLVRTESLLDQSGQQRLNVILDSHQLLAIAYQYRTALQKIWTRTTANPRELLEALQHWQQQALATGVLVLSQFAENLAKYTSHPEKI
jgi:stearoyl-CoA desaturase (Delta-9 desaturase)